MIVPFGLRKNSTVLISGCGGGFDFLCGLPIGLELENRGHKVVYSSYSFTDLQAIPQGRWINDELVLINETTKDLKDSSYFPEKVYCDWYAQRYGKSSLVYGYNNLGVVPLIDLFNTIKIAEGVDYHFVVDGGSDGLLRGDEYNLGSPTIDAISIIAGSQSKITYKYFVSTAFGTEGVGKSVSHAEVLENMACTLSQQKMLGVTSIINNPRIQAEFEDCFVYLFNHVPQVHHSTIVGSIAAALRGLFGDHAVNYKTKRAPVWLSPLTTLLWYFNLPAIAKNKLYYDEGLQTVTSGEIGHIITRRKRSIARKTPIPI